MPDTVGAHICRISGDTLGGPDRDQDRPVHNRRMDLPVMPPAKPMLAKSVSAIPPGMQYKAK
ncbi:hypothetical protein GCM10010327_62240 [Streptomyces nitrosporeus]|nr:hypothetical protein GCM10010327_62240 [Streptomyces nitrosporeus]